MATLAELAEAVNTLDELLDEDLLEPDPRRAWSDLESRLAVVEQTLGRLLPALGTAFDELPEKERPGARERTAGTLGRCAATLQAAGRASSADDLLARASWLAAEPALREELSSARANVDHYVRLQHARWLARHGRKNASAVLRSLAREVQDPALRRAVQAELSAPRPLTSAPSMATLNGIGTRLYGKRDVRDDGTYVSTLCFCVLFVPVFPIAAYRVRDEGGGTYRFFSREPLSAFARRARVTPLVLLALAAGPVVLDAYLNDPGRLAAREKAEVQELERAGKKAEAAQRYRLLATRFPDTGPGSEAAEAYVRLSLGAVPDPLPEARATQAGKLTAEVAALPASARKGRPSELMAGALVRWADQLAAAGLPGTRSGLELLRKGQALDAGGKLRSALQRLERGLGDRLAEERPVDALRHYALAAGDPAATAAAERVAASLVDPALWLEVAPEELAVLPATARAAAGATQERARAQAEADEPLVGQQDTRSLRDALRRRPGDLALSAALARRLYQAGDAAACVATLRPLGAPGRLTGDGQQALGACLAALGDLKAAESALEPYLDERLPLYLRAREAYRRAASQAEQRLREKVQRGQVPPEIRAALDKASPADKPGIAQEWIGGVLDGDPSLRRLAEDLFRHGAVAPACLTLGGVKLRLAAALTPAERQPLLSSAERFYLAVQAEAEGSPTYHLGLGRVFHQLGKTKQGEAEFASLLARKQPELTFAVIDAYRDLGLVERAWQVGEALWKEATAAEVKQGAAWALAHLTNDLQDEETWLRRSDPSSRAVKLLLAQNQGRRALRDGRRAEADAAFARVAAAYDREAKHDATSANNAAVAYSFRFAATGDLAQLATSVSRLQQSVRLEGEEPVTLGNLAGSLASLAYLRVVDRFVHTRVLLVDGSEARLLLGELLEGALRPRVLEALASEPALGQALEVERREQALAPRKADAYAIELGWHRWREDAAALHALAQRLAQLEHVESGRSAERDAWLAGHKDEEYRKLLEQRQAHAEQRIQRARRAGHAPTLAAALLLKADVLDDAARLDGDPAVWDAVVALRREAVETWAESGAYEDLAYAHFAAAGARARQRSGALRAAWEKERRLHGWAVLVHRVQAGPGAADVVAALRAEPDLDRAVQIVARGGLRPKVWHWVLARVAGNAELEARAVKVFARPDLLPGDEAEARLAPDTPGSGASLELVRAGQAALARGSRQG